METDARPRDDGGRPWVIKLHRRLNAPPQRAFRAWADPDELVRWLPSRIEGGLAVDTRSTLVWRDERVWWDVTEAEPDRLFTFRRPWSADETLVTLVTVRIETVGYGSRLHLEDGPFPVDQPAALEGWKSALEHWVWALAQLRAYLDFSVDLRWRSGS
ncbi:MAG: SRPBCC domain-containing protein [Candidatus Limnocylindrales bacterium]